MTQVIPRTQPASGFSLIEVVLAITMISTVLLSIMLYYKKVQDVSETTTRHIQSGFLIEEGLEAIKLLRDTSWSTNIAPLSTSTSYYLFWTGTVWTATTTPQNVENTFARTFKLSDVKRDGSDNIAQAGTLDPGTKKVDVYISWQKRGGTMATDTAETYITNLFSN